MKFKFRCPHCSRTIRAGSGHAGRTTRCPNCRRRIVVPKPDVIGDEDVLDILDAPEPAAATERRPPVAAPADFFQAVADAENPDALIDALCSFEPDAIERGLASVEGGRYEDFVQAARAVCPWIFLGRILLGYQAYRAKGAEWSRLPDTLDHVRCWGILHPRLLPWVRDNVHAGVIQKDAFDLAMDLVSGDRDETKYVLDPALTDSLAQILHAHVASAAKEQASLLLVLPMTQHVHFWLIGPRVSYELVPAPLVLRDRIMAYLRAHMRPDGTIIFRFQHKSVCVRGAFRRTVHGQAAALYFRGALTRFCPHCGAQLRDEGDLCVPCATRRLPDTTSIRETWQSASCERCGRHFK